MKRLNRFLLTFLENHNKSAVKHSFKALLGTALTLALAVERQLKVHEMPALAFKA
jgi:hypothetical protein